MYPVFLIVHSLVRWLVLATLIAAIYISFKGMRSRQPFTRKDNIFRALAAGMAHTQLVIGLALYFSSPITIYFLENFSEGIHNRDIRFFGMEHITMMIIAVVFITIGSAKARKAMEDHKKFKAMAVWFTIALVIIFLSIPWPFSPFTARPFWRF